MKRLNFGHREGNHFPDPGRKFMSRFTDKFMMVASEKPRNFYMITFKFIFSAKYRKKVIFFE